MKLRNKKTGEIGTPECSLGLFNVQIIRPDEISNFSYDSLAELNEEWEDYEEPKEF